MSKIATGACPIAGASAGFALLPLAACLRFAQVQRSVDLQLKGPCLFGLCTRGKSREQRVRKPFEWACPHSFLGCNSVFRHALLVVNDLRGRLQREPKFVIPDLLLGPSASIGPGAVWTAKPMRLQKFIELLRALVLQACSVQPSDLTSYSLRRFLPTIAEILRCPPEVAHYLGNWTEAVHLKHVQSQRCPSIMPMIKSPQLQIPKRDYCKPSRKPRISLVIVRFLFRPCEIVVSNGLL